MKINLRELSRKGGRTTLSIELLDRLPPHVAATNQLACALSVNVCDPYYLLDIDTKGALAVKCQRCLNVFTYPFEQQTQIAVCSSEADAQQVSEAQDYIIARFYDVDIAEIITDDLHLFVPEKHPHVGDCDVIIANGASVPMNLG